MSTCIVIPTYNEAENILSLLAEIEKHVECTVLVVDDNSPDGTGDLVERHTNENVYLLRRKKKDGLGMAYRAGFQWALEKEFISIVQMDADFSHHPKYLVDLIKQGGDNNLVLGSRYIKEGGVSGWGVHRYLASKSAMTTARVLLGLPAKDVTSGFRLWSSRLLSQVLQEQIASTGYAFQEEMLFHAYRVGGDVIETPITFFEREKGNSKLGSTDIKEFFFMLYRLRKEYGKLR